MTDEYGYSDPYKKMTKKELISIINTQAQNYRSEAASKKEQADRQINELKQRLIDTRTQQVGQILQSMSSMMECVTRVTLLLK